MASSPVQASSVSCDEATAKQLAWTILDTFLRMKAVSDRIMAAAGQSTPRFSLLHEVAVSGPQTVAAVARVRRAARQGVQRLASELVADGLLAFTPNPHHRRSPLLNLTAKGRRVTFKLIAQQDRLARKIAPDLDPDAVRIAIQVLQSFGRLVER